MSAGIGPNFSAQRHTHMHIPAMASQVPDDVIELLARHAGSPERGLLEICGWQRNIALVWSCVPQCSISKYDPNSIVYFIPFSLTILLEH